MNKLHRLWNHLIATHWRMRALFPPASLDQLERATAAAETGHAGELRLVIESSLDFQSILAGKTARDRAREVFGLLGVWDTQANNGVLIYLLLADRRVEVVADRGFRELVTPEEWQRVCRLMEVEFRAGRFPEGAKAGIEAAGLLIGRHFPGTGARNELPDRPVLL